MRIGNVIALFGVVAAVQVAVSSGAHAEDHVCGHAADGNFEVDGILDDWNGFRGTGVDKQSEDRAFVLRCAYDSKRLYLSVNIRDDQVARGKGARNDQVSVTVSAPGGRAVKLWARPGTEDVEPARGGAKRGVAIEDSLQEHGWSLELSVDLTAIPEFGGGVSALKANISYQDSDRGQKSEAIGFRGKLVFSDALALYRAFLQQTGLRKKDIRLDVLADVDPGKGAERILAGGTVIGVLDRQFTYMTLPVRSAADVVDVRVVDLSGTGRSSIITQYRQHGGGGTRDVVHIWRVASDGSFETQLAFEVRKQLGDRRIENSWTLVPKGQGALKKKLKKKWTRKGKKKKGFDILVEVAEVTGWDQETFREIPSTDAAPILLPWAEQPIVLHVFEEGTYIGPEYPEQS